MRFRVVRSLVVSAALAAGALVPAAVHANMPPPPLLKIELGGVIEGLLGDGPYAAWSAQKNLVVFTETWSQEGTGQGMSVAIAPTSGAPGTRVEVFEPHTDLESESDKAAVMSKARIALKAELAGADWKALTFTAWPTKPGKGEPVRLPKLEVASAQVTLEVKKQVIYAKVPGMKAPKKLLDLKKDGEGDTHVPEVQGVFADANCPYVVVQVHFEPKDYTEYNALTQAFVVKIPTAPPSK
jgi:hypothetical protein